MKNEMKKCHPPTWTWICATCAADNRPAETISITLSFSADERALLKGIENQYIRHVKKRSKRKFYSKMIVYALSQMAKNILEELAAQNSNRSPHLLALQDMKKFDKLWHKLFVSIVDKEEHSLPVGE